MCKQGICAKCHNVRILERHHCLPIRFYGRKGNYSTLMVCKDCHHDIETILPRTFELAKDEYLEITHQWLLGKTPIVFIQGS